MAVTLMLVAAAAFPVCGYRNARARGRRPELWATLCFLFGIFALAALFLMPKLTSAGEATA